MGPQFPDQGSNLHSLQWKCGVLTTGLPRKSCSQFFLAALGLCCCSWAFFSCSKLGANVWLWYKGFSAVASLVTEHGLSVCGLQ